jgi:hypothetical protein
MKVGGFMLAISLLPILAACKQSGDQTNRVAISPTETTAQQQGTNTSMSSTSTGTPDRKEAFATMLAVTREAMKTEVALTAYPTRTPGRPPSQPTDILGTGIFQSDDMLNRQLLGRQVYNLWQGWVNGQYLEVQAGYKVDAEEIEPKQGVLVAFTRDQIPIDETRDYGDYYLTPSRVGAIRITEANGMVLTVQTLDDQYSFTFDLATHQWAIATPLPIGTATASPSETALSSAIVERTMISIVGLSYLSANSANIIH